MKHVGLFSVVALAIVGNHAQAGLTFYTSMGGYEAATFGNTAVNFEGIASDDSFTSEPTPPGLTLSGVKFTIDHTNNTGDLYVLGPNYYYANLSALSSQLSSTGPNNMLITLPRPYTAFALEFGTFKGSQLDFTLSTGSTFNASTPPFPDLSFVGVTSTTPITSIQIVEPTQSDVVNVVSFSFGSAVPEPSTLTLAGIAAVCGLSYWPLIRRRPLRRN
jgi:PEP-CTERM motif